MVSFNDYFRTIQNNTAIKQSAILSTAIKNFGTIQNNTALKLRTPPIRKYHNFETIQNNTALKRLAHD